MNHATPPKLFLAILFLTLTACGGEGDGSEDASNNQVGAFHAATKGAECTLKDSRGNLLTKQITGEDGTVSFAGVNIPAGVVSLTCTGGQYTDEATGKTINPAPTTRAATNYTGGELKLFTSPLSEIAYQRADADGNLSDIADHNSEVSRAFGLRNPEFTHLIPTDLSTTAADTDTAGLKAIVLAAISQMAATQGVPQKDIIPQFVESNLSDDMINQLIAAIDTISNSNTGELQASTEAVNQLKSNIENDNYAALNDTGITFAGDSDTTNAADCTATGDFATQDCHTGRDAQASANTLSKIGAGAAGFDFTKLGSTGNVLSIQNQSWETGGTGTEAEGTKWSCVKDNHTGLIWEVKTTDDGIHNANNTYRWGGKTAQGTGFATYYDDWDILVDGSNSESLCGFTDWRVPNRYELRSIVHLGVSKPAIDTDYFPNTPSAWVWSSSPRANYSDYAWNIYFNSGNTDSGYRNVSYRVRLVRSGE